VAYESECEPGGLYGAEESVVRCADREVRDASTDPQDSHGPVRQQELEVETTDVAVDVQIGQTTTVNT